MQPGTHARRLVSGHQLVNGVRPHLHKDKDKGSLVGITQSRRGGAPAALQYPPLEVRRLNAGKISSPH